MPDADLLAVRLGALALAVADAQHARHPAALAAEAPDAPLLNSIAQTPGLKVEELSAILALSHSGTVRALDRLARKGLVERKPHADDARAVALHLTEAGAQVAADLQAGRKAALRDSLCGMADADLSRAADVVDLLLARLVRHRATSDRTCRLCDETLCTPDICPAESFARTTPALP
jgi:MarR family transcriptional regulator, negative regulator of the multidrug operon emrRAB